MGKPSRIPKSPDKAQLETVPNPHPGSLYVVRFAAPEFTTLCPVTGQPDFAHLVIDYVPRDLLVESKSLKLYLSSFRNHADFHEACTVAVGKKLDEALTPHWLRIGGYCIREAASPSTSSTQSAICRMASGSPTRALRLTVGAAKREP